MKVKKIRAYQECAEAIKERPPAVSSWVFKDCLDYSL